MGTVVKWSGNHVCSDSRARVMAVKSPCIPMPHAAENARCDAQELVDRLRDDELRRALAEIINPARAKILLLAECRQVPEQALRASCLRKQKY